MPDYDLVLRHASLVLTDRVDQADLGISEGRITAIGPALRGSVGEEIDASQLHVFPGVIDAHVHFNEPGRADWEGLDTGSRAVAAGGGTCFFDMPLNSTPPVLDGASFDAKRTAAEAKSVVDFALWGGLTPINLDHLEELRDRGVIGFKAFMSNSGIDDFPRADLNTLKAGMKEAARLGLLVATHAESEEMTGALAEKRRSQGRTSIRDYLDSRPIAAEVEAIDEACCLAGETGCALHVVHVSSLEGLERIEHFRASGVNVTAETCPHYLVLSEDDVLALGAVAKCAPPLRSAADRDRLRAAAWQGRIDTLGSDHSPAPPELKTSADFFKVWGGVGGAQHLFPLILDAYLRDQKTNWPLLADLLATGIAERFNLPPDYGRVAVGAAANLALVDLAGEDSIDIARLHYRHPLTPYAGRKLRGRVVQTLIRGQTAARDGQATGASAGRLVIPHSA